MNKENYQIAENLREMLREGKTYLEIIQLNKHNEKYEGRTVAIVEDFIKNVTADEIYEYMMEMPIVDVTDYNKIIEFMIKQFNNESLSVIIKIPLKTINQFHINYTSDKEGFDGTIILCVCGLILILIGAWWCFFEKNL